MSTQPKARQGQPGPFRADSLRSGDRYELSNGHPLYCFPTAGNGARRVGLGFGVLDTDPAVSEAGVDPGYSFGPHDLRAPDIAVGHVPDAPGWIKDGVPPLTVEYAGSGQDEAALSTKIEDLLSRGTRFIWVARLEHPQHVEVHEPGQMVRYVDLNGTLEAPGILKNAVPARALFDREVAHQRVLDNLIQRRGYASFDAALRDSIERGLAQGLEQGLEQGREEGREEGLEQGREEGREEGMTEGQRAMAERQLTRRFGALPTWAQSRLAGAAGAELVAILDAILDAPTLEAVFGP